MRRILTAVSAAFVAVAFSVATAGEAAAQNLNRSYWVTPEEGSSFEAALEFHVQERMEHDDPWNWEVYEIVNGAELGQFVIRSGGHSWSDFDAYQQGFGGEAGEHFEEDVLPSIEHVSSAITWTDMEHSRMPESFEDIRLYQVIQFHVKPGMGDEIDEAQARYHEAIVEADWPSYYAWIQLVNGEGADRTLVIFHENWADFAQPDRSLEEIMQEAFGEEEAEQISDQFDAAVHKSKSMVALYRPDLSVTAQEEGEQ